MNKLFDASSPFWKAMGRIFDAFVLNIMWLLFSIPIFTIGPATTAFYYAMVGMLRGDGGYISKDFTKSFKMNLKQGILIGFPLTLVGAFLAFDIYLCYHAGRGIYTFFLFFFLIMFLLWFALSIYIFFILAKFEKKTSDLLIWAFSECIKNLPKTLYMMFITVFGIWIIRIMPGLVLIIPGIIVENHCAILMKIFEPYLPTPYEMETMNEEFSADDIDDANQWLL